MKYGFNYETVIGNLCIMESEKGICEISFSKQEDVFEKKETQLIKTTYNQLQEYFEGTRKEFTIPLDMKGTSFQEKTWRALLTIPYGKTWSYKELAQAVGNDKASRAVGNANNKNKLAIVIPCHRVVGSSGKLVGYAGGLDKKEFLLDLESRHT